MLPNNRHTDDHYGYAALAVAGTFLAVLLFADLAGTATGPRSNDHGPH